MIAMICKIQPKYNCIRRQARNNHNHRHCNFREKKTNLRLTPTVSVICH